MTAPLAERSALGEPRETSGATTGLLVRYVRERGGDAAVEEVLRRAGVPLTAQELEDESRWSGYDTRIRLFAAATEVLDDPGTAFGIGATALTHGLNHSLVLLVRALGSPRQVFRQLPRAVPKFSTTSTMEIVESGASCATIRYRLHQGYAHSRLDCEYAQGLFAMVPTVFGLPPARIVHDECESDGSAVCVYHLTWEDRSRLPWRRRTALAVDHELHALRGQLQALQNAATELVSSDELDTVLQRIVDRVATAVLAPGYLLAVHGPAGQGPRVHSTGLDPERAAELAAALLAGEDLGPHAVVVDVASARHAHGRLAALYTADGRGMVDERSMLAAYAGHAAAALDLLVALEETRCEASRARALLTLAHQLARTSDAGTVATTVAGALPGIVGCSSASVLLWHAETGQLRTAAAVGWPAPQEALLRGTAITPADTPELAEMLTDPEPRLLSTGEASSALRTLLTALDKPDLVAVPLFTGDTFLGAIAATWPAGQTPVTLQDDTLARLRGAADQASTALLNAQLLDTVRHQALHDALTGLPNRVLLHDRLTQELAGAGRHGGVGLLFCDLDEFKPVNDTHGHAAGDELLRQVAARLLGVVRPGDTVGRLSGDEFAVLLPGLSDRDLARALADRVVACLREPFRIGAVQLRISTSVGVAVHAGPDGNADQLLRAADDAMYTAKQTGRDRVSAA